MIKHYAKTVRVYVAVFCVLTPNWGTCYYGLGRISLDFGEVRLVKMVVDTNKASLRKRKTGHVAAKNDKKKVRVEKKEKTKTESKPFTSKKGVFKDSKTSFKAKSSENKPNVVLDRKARKALAEERKKKRKPNYDLEKAVIAAWEKIRQRNLELSEKKKMTSDLIEKMKGKISELAVSHTCSRVVQSCVKNGTPEERNKIFEELKPNCLSLSQNTYAHHLVNKMMEHGTKEQRNQIISLFYGNVLPFLRHPVASQVIEQAFQLSNGAQKHALLSEFYSPEHRLFKDGLSGGKIKRLPEVLEEAGEAKRRSILEHFAISIQPIVEKGIVDHSIVHRALNEFLSSAPQRLWVDIVEQLSGPLLVRMIHTREGANVAAKCVAAGSAKERKKIVKALKDHVLKVAMDDYGYLALLQIFEVVDDTLLVRKTIISELVKDLKGLALHKNGSRVLLHLLAPKVPRYFSKDVIASLSEVIVKKEAPVQEEEVGEDDETEEGGEKLKQMGVSKKDPEVRRKELLIDSKLAQELVKVCKENADELLRSRFGSDVIFEVSVGGHGEILNKSTDFDVGDVHSIIADLAALPRSSTTAADNSENSPADADGDRGEHILDQFFSSRTIRRLIALQGVSTATSFAKALWDRAFKGKCGDLALGHSAKIVAALSLCDDIATKKEVIEELGPLYEKGSLKAIEGLLPEDVKNRPPVESIPKSGKAKAARSKQAAELKGKKLKSSS